jgi:hypothetical protein
VKPIVGLALAFQGALGSSVARSIGGGLRHPHGFTVMRDSHRHRYRLWRASEIGAIHIQLPRPGKISLVGESARNGTN